jgi:enoyl-CoA hydratase/carnithine racemase
MELVRTEDRDRVRHVVLNRPEKRNAMNQALLTELADAVREAGADASVHCVILRGEGPVFSAGVDLGELGGLAAAADGSRDPLRPFRNVFLAAANLCEEIPKPVICQIHGACIGGALEVALGCDMRVMAGGAQVGLPEVKLGLIPDVGGCSRLPAVVGLGRAKELIMTGRPISAEEAERIGLANRVAPADELDAAVQALVDELLANSPVAVGRAKRVMDAAAKPALAQTLELEVTAQEVCMAALKAKMAVAPAAEAEAAAAVS